MAFSFPEIDEYSAVIAQVFISSITLLEERSKPVATRNVPDPWCGNRNVEYTIKIEVKDSHSFSEALIR